MERDVVGAIKMNKLRWVGHLKRKEAPDPVMQIFSQNPLGSRPRVRPRGRWGRVKWRMT